jgi:hypothetical protein
MNRFCGWLFVLIVFFIYISAASAQQDQIRSARIPKVIRAPKLEDFLNNTPREAELKITDFRQFDPGDGDTVSQPTTAYLSYDDKNLYVAFVCKDDPSKIRAQITRRDALLSDDRVDISIDTFHDHRRNYWFEVNPYGIQMDGTNTDGMDDLNFDTLWYSDGRITQDGYTVLMAIPFKSLRFPNNQTQTWGLLLARSIQRNNEWSNWPYMTRRLLPSWAGQFGILEGLENISPGRNLQFIPYGLFSSARYINPYEPGAEYHTDNDPRAGLDAKMVLRDALTLDMTVNPDFSQVESDSPQVTVNQRYEVFFPEKRPFFIENSDYFQTPENLFFSRRMVDPQVGMRLTGKLGRWGIGALAGDDRAPGELLPEEDSQHDGRAAIGAFRLYRELGKESRAGALFTTRDFGPSSNRVLAFDTRLKLQQNLTLTGQWMNSWTHDMDGNTRSGAAALVRVSQSGRKFHMNAYHRERSPDFETQLGFIQRVDMRETGYDMGYAWRPEKSALVSYGPHIAGSVIWDTHGTLTDWQFTPSFMFELTRITSINISRTESFERFDGIDFRKNSNSIMVNSELLRWLYLSGDISSGERINYYPAPGLKPFLAKSLEGSFGFTLQPSSRLRLDEMYLYSRLATGEAAAATVFNNHILRSKANYQFNRELSLRAIVDYNAILPNASYIFLEKTKRLGFDVLLTYMLHPGTALHVGYTDNYENLRMDLGVSPWLQRTGSPDFSVGRQFFIKLSYLLRM